MKTIAELARECGVHRTTLNKAADRGAIPARKSGSILLIDEESEQFKHWLAGTKLGRPRKESTMKLNTSIGPERRTYILDQMQEKGYPVASFRDQNFTLYDLLNFFDPGQKDTSTRNEITNIVGYA